MKTCLLFLFIVLVISIANAARKTELTRANIESLFKKAALNKLTEHESQDLQDVLEILRRPKYLTAKTTANNSDLRNTLDCIICRSAFAAVFDAVKNGQTDEQLSEVISFFCVLLNIENDEVCHGAVSSNVPIIHYIIERASSARPEEFCGLIMQNAHDPNVCAYNPGRFDFTVEIPLPPALIPEPIASSESLTVAILTDAHIDPMYEAYGVANCDAPTCCRKGQRPARSSFQANNYQTEEALVKKSIFRFEGEIMMGLTHAAKLREMRSLQNQTKPTPKYVEPAGYWGDYRDCDTPLWAYDDVIERISEAHKNIDVIYYIGDTIDHGVWETSVELINEMNKYVVDKIQDHFGDDVLVVPAIGNHESQPTNQFAPSRVTGDLLNTTWLYEALADKWGQYLTEEARQTLVDRGDFSVLVRPGLRVISLNNNVAYKYNWWLVYDPLDSKRHLDWLVDELYKAESAGERVHILAHIPPGVSDLTHTWTREYNKIVNRFSATIAAEFNGHTHSDEFKVFYNGAGDAVNVAWGGGSATSYSHYNLNYKIATFDPQTYLPQNIVNYVYNLTEANLTPNRRPHWFQLYDMRNSFGLQDLSANSIGTLVERMVTTDKQLLDVYSAFYSKINDNRMAWCNIDCKLDNLCKTVVTVLWERQKCNELREQYYSSRNVNG